MKPIDEFKKIKTDKGRWEYLLKNKGCGLIVMLDNDDTFVVEGEDGECEAESFMEYIGNSNGVTILLDCLGINYEHV